MFNLFKSKKTLIWSGVGVLVIVILIVILSGNGTPVYETAIASRGNLVQEVSVTGKVQPAESVDLQFQNSGRISAINYKAGDKVRTGVIIASIESQDLQATVLEKEASLLSAQAELNKTIKNSHSLNDASISSSLRTALDNAKSNLEQVIKKADADMASKYNSALNSMSQAITGIDTASTVVRDIYTNYLQSMYAYSYIENLRVLALGQKESARQRYPIIDQPYASVSPSSYLQVDGALQEILKTSQTMLSSLTGLQNEIQSNVNIISSTDRTRVNTEAAAVSSDLSALSSAIQDIASQKVTNTKNVADAQSTLATAQTAFPTPEDIIQKQAALKQAEASLLSARSQLRKSLIIAPFEGIIARIDAERGQTVSSTTPIISFISASGYQVKANITEVEISKVSIGNQALVALDAYGDEKVFKAKVSSIDPGETIIEGVTTYEAVFDFEQTQEGSIRPNMTANVIIQTNTRENVIVIPQRAVINRNGESVVRVQNNGAVQDKVVQVGLSGNNGNIEINSGILEGEQVITSAIE